MKRNFVIGFIVQNPFHYFLYHSVIENLIDRDIQCHLLINDDIKKDKEWESMYNGLIGFLEKIERNDIEAFLISTVEESEFMYDYIVSPYYMSSLQKISKKNARLMYGLAKESWNYSWWNIFYDKIFCYGNYDFAKLNIYNNCSIVGNPKFDNWHNDNIPDRDDLEKKYKIKLKSGKETILYAPTYGEFSSIDKWIKKLVEIKEDFNVIIKLHHGTAYLLSEKTRRKNIEKYFFNVLDDSIDLLHVLKVSDYIVSDNSGIIFDAILAEKKILLLNTQYNEENIDEKSIEYDIRKEIININDTENILEVIKDKKLWDIQNNKIENLRIKYFSKLDGNAGKRVAEELISLLNNGDEGTNNLLISLREKICGRL